MEHDELCSFFKYFRTQWGPDSHVHRLDGSLILVHFVIIASLTGGMKVHILGALGVINDLKEQTGQ